MPGYGLPPDWMADQGHVSQVGPWDVQPPSIELHSRPGQITLTQSESNEQLTSHAQLLPHPMPRQAPCASHTMLHAAWPHWMLRQEF